MENNKEYRKFQAVSYNKNVEGEIVTENGSLRWLYPAMESNANLI